MTFATMIMVPKYSGVNKASSMGFLISTGHKGKGEALMIHKWFLLILKNIKKPMLSSQLNFNPPHSFV